MKKVKEEVEVKAEDQVSVEMSAADKDAFVKWQSEKKVSDEKKADLNDIIINLRMGHNINGRAYGPGQVQVKEDLGYALLERDELAIKARMRVHEGSEFMIQILGAGVSKVTQVKRAGL